MNDSPVGILLAAGRATRFGSDKLLHELPNGIPLGAASARNLRAVLPRVLAVVRDRQDPIARRLVGMGCELCVCESAETGIGASIASAVAATGEASGWLVALADMPFIRPETIARVVAEWRAGAPLVAPAFHGRRGHPVVIAATFRDALLGLRGDSGAKSILRSHAELLAVVDCDDPGVLLDIDTRADLLSLALANRLATATDSTPTTACSIS